MCRDLTLCRKPSVLKTSINIITTTATPTFRALRSWTSEGEDRGEGDKWSPCRLRVASFLRVHATSGFPPKLSVKVDGAHRQPRLTQRHFSGCCLKYLKSGGG